MDLVNKRPLLTVLLILLIALQSVVASADVHALFNAPIDHNDLPLEHIHSGDTSVHGHSSNEEHTSADIQQNSFDQASDQNTEINCEHCCHCHNPNPVSALVKELSSHRDSLDLQSLRTTYQKRSELHSPALRPPIANV